MTAPNSIHEEAFWDQVPAAFLRTLVEQGRDNACGVVRGAGGVPSLLQPAPQQFHVGGQAGVLDLTQQRLVQLQVGAQPVDGVGQAEFAGEHRALWAHDGQRQEAAVVAAQPRQQPG